MQRVFYRRQRQLAYEYRVGLAKKRGIRPGIYVGLVLVASLLSANLAIFQAEVSAHTSSKASVQSLQTTVASPLQLKPTLQTTQPVVGESSRLDGIIASFAQSHPQVMWSVSVQGLGTDLVTANYNAGQVYNSASIYKLLLLYPLSQKLPYAQWATTKLKVGSRTLSVQDCVSAMLKVSDNACGLAVGDYVGWAWADTQLKSIGLTSTVLNRASGPVTTAADTTKYLSQLYSGNLFDSDSRQFILDALSQQIYRSGIPAGCPQCDVSDKIGDLGNVRHDVGIVSSGNKTYILSIFTSGASFAKIAEMTAQTQAFMDSN